MASMFIQIALVAAGMAICAGLFIGYPGKGLRSAVFGIAILIAAAFVIYAIDRFAR
jgi:hypothetical protein